MEQLIIPEYESMVLTKDQNNALYERAVQLELYELDGESLETYIAIRGILIEDLDIKGYISGFYTCVTEKISSDAEKDRYIYRVYPFNELDKAVKCAMEIRHKYFFNSIQGATIRTVDAMLELIS